MTGPRATMRCHGGCRGRASAVAAALAVAACSGPPPPPAQNSPPAPAAVRDGIGGDLDTQSVTSSLFANWDAFVDPEGSPVLYEWCIGTAPGAADVMPWSDVGGATSASTATGVDLPVDRMLFVSVRARDTTGAHSGVSTSDGIVLGIPEAPWRPPGETGAEAATQPTPTSDAPAPGSHLIAVERFGTTWTFDRPARCGRFVNGDWWVVGPVAVVEISPACRIDDGRARHGSMIDPDPTSTRQGYDSAMFGGAAAGYDAAANMGLGVSRERPLQLAPGSSLVSATSAAPQGAMPQLETCAVLTCVAEPPPDDAFRPPYCGRDKVCRWRARDLDLSRLARLAPERGAPDPTDLAARLERTWLDHVPGWQGRYLHPSANMPDYGRDMADLVGQAALVLQLDIPAEQKRPLAVRLVQLGIDNYGVVASGGSFVADGGSGSGRKFPVLLAGVLLGDEDLMLCAREAKLRFAEDAQTFYVEETAPGVFNGGHGGYGAGDVGLAEWGQRHADDPQLDRKPWTADDYRRCCSANAWSGFLLAARVMGLREAWGHDALFDYVDRYMQIEPRGAWTRCWSPFVERMWDRYRGDF